MNNPEMEKTHEDWINEYYTSYFEAIRLHLLKTSSLTRCILMLTM